MTDKEAIEILNSFKSTSILHGDTFVIHNGNLKKKNEAITTLLLSYEVLCNELDKKNKEIEELKDKILRKSGRELLKQENYLKQKIQEKIDELEEEYEYLSEENKRVNKFEIEMLQELLKGEDE